MTDVSAEDLLNRMRESRGSAAELKLQLINARAQSPRSIIFVFEGDDDRGVFHSWTRFVDAAFRYEPLTCRGKRAVLRLKEAVDRDVGDLRLGVFFFIDRDFDDARGVELDGSIYMTETYSIENCLVNKEVIEEILKIELNCHGQPDLRNGICLSFDGLYQNFVDITRDVNRLLYAARQLNVDLESEVPNSIARVVAVSHDRVERLPTTPEEFLRPVRVITEAELEELEPSFSELEGKARYRGKFAMSFLIRWLESLARERREQLTSLFRGLDAQSRTRVDRLNSVTLAARSNPPPSYVDFLRERVFPLANH